MNPGNAIWRPTGAIVPDGARAGQQGVVLLVSLLVLLLLAVIATTVASTNLLQLHMAGNSEARIAALQHALAAVDAVLADDASTPLDSRLGYSICTVASLDRACDENTVELPAGLAPAVGRLDVAVLRLAPLSSRMPVMSESNASSTVFYRVARFEVSGTYDGAADRLGRAGVTQGVLVRQAVSIN